jgi:hypothetical protein
VKIVYGITEIAKDGVRLAPLAAIAAGAAIGMVCLGRHLALNTFRAGRIQRIFWAAPVPHWANWPSCWRGHFTQA